ncbi:MAG: 4Fe-4S binding protein [Bacteroides sp.]|nr:4Fe-4S binding protein [Bacteroides sp.]
MINIKDKKDCVGCNACIQRCPKQCISMHEDKQGFLYPKVNLELCINCGLCEKVCPVINQTGCMEPLAIYAAKNNNKEIQLASSSGGIFFALAKKVIDENGIVFGARFNENWEVVHDYTETVEGIKAFQTSKYVQSRIGETFLQAERFLKEGKVVLFSGTPCQIIGLRLFLKKEYDNLIAVDVVCHGVPSPAIWRDYLKHITLMPGDLVNKNSASKSTLNEKNLPVITGINFRDKRLGWEKYGFSVHAVAHKCNKNMDSKSNVNISNEFELLFEPLNRNIFMQGFLKNLYLRPSCYSCPSKCGKSNSDITLADYWGIYREDPVFYDKNGVSLLLVMTKTGYDLISKIDITLRNTSYDNAVKYNPAIIHSTKRPLEYDKFWSEYYCKGLGALRESLDRHRPSLSRRLLSVGKDIIRPMYLSILKLFSK